MENVHFHELGYFVTPVRTDSMLYWVFHYAWSNLMQDSGVYKVLMVHWFNKISCEWLNLGLKDLMQIYLPIWLVATEDRHAIICQKSCVYYKVYIVTCVYYKVHIVTCVYYIVYIVTCVYYKLCGEDVWVCIDRPKEGLRPCRSWMSTS